MRLCDCKNPFKNMNRFRNFILLLLLSLRVYAQVEKNAVLFGLHNSLILNKNSSISFVLSPQIGYFVKKKMLLGVSMPPSNSGKTLSGIFVPSDGYLKNSKFLGANELSISDVSLATALRYSFRLIFD